MKFYEIPSNLSAELDELESLIQQHLKGEIEKAKLRAIRVPFGVYEQRKDGTYMVRIRCTAGGVTPAQLSAASVLAKQYGSGIVHITTRQEIQLHDVALENIVPLMRKLLDAGLSTRGGGGNTVRNINASADSGIAQNEVFDVTPYAVDITSRLAADSGSWKLPRKFKIAFGNSEPDNIQARFNDLGFIARIENGRKGFLVSVAGGMGTKPQVGSVLHDFIPAQDAYAVTLAVRNVFSAHGNRRNRHAARLRFLWNSIGEDQFRRFYNEELKQIAANHSADLDVSEWPSAPVSAPNLPSISLAEGYATWRKRYVRAQKQPGLFSALVPVSLGIVDADRLLRFSEFLQLLGEDVLRFTIDQNILLRNLPEQVLGHVYAQCRALSALTDGPALFANWISCAGADTCRLGVCRPRELVKAAQAQLAASGLDLDSFADLVVNFSGCPNTCGQHMAADIGFFGKVARKDEEMLPAYAVVAGAVRGGDRARLAQTVGDVPARAVPAVIEDLLRTYLRVKKGSVSFREWIEEGGAAELAPACARHKAVPSFDEDKNYYFDWGAREQFSLKGKGAGECSAGLFDLIELDLNAAKALRTELSQVQNSAGTDSIKIRKQMVLSASRALLITQAIDAKTEREALTAFLDRFIGCGLVETRFALIVSAVRDGDMESLKDPAGLAGQLVDAVDALYRSMDDSLMFPVQKEAPKTSPEQTAPAIEKDLRGVACPMNFVKAKMELAKIKTGQSLRILLDDGAPIENVPRSVEQEGHQITAITREGPHWAVSIRKQGPQ